MGVIIKLQSLNKPFVRVSSFNTTNEYETIFNALMSSKGSYTLHDFFDKKKVVYDLPMNLKNFQFTLPDSGIQFSHLAFQLLTTESYQHDSMYDTYDTNYALNNIKKLEIEGIYDNEKLIRKKWNLDDKDDQNEIYQNYLAYTTGGGLSLTNHYHYHKVQRDSGTYVNGKKQLKDSTNYFKQDHRYQKDPIIDIRPIKGYTLANDSPMPNIKPKITMELRDATTKGYKLVILCIHPASYDLITNDSRVNQIVYRTISYKN